MSDSNQRSPLGLYLNNAGASIVARLVQMTALFWVNRHLLRRIEAAEYALFPLVVSLMCFAEWLRSMFASGVSRFIVEADARGDAGRVTQIVTSMFPISASVGGLIATVGSCAAWNIGSLISVAPQFLPQAQLMLGLLVFSLAVEVAVAPISEGAYIRQRFVALSALNLSCEAARLVLLLGLMLGLGARVQWLVVASTISGMLHLTVRICLTRRWVPAIRWRRGAFDPATAGQVLRFSVWASLQGVSGVVLGTLPTLMLNRFAGPAALASFYLGRLPDLQIRSLINVAAYPVTPALTRLYACKGEKALVDFYYRGGRYFLWLTLLPAAPLIAFAPELVRLYAGDQYAQAAWVMIALLCGYPFLWASAMFFQLAHAMGRIRSFYLSDTIAQMGSLAVIWLAVAPLRMGALGAALGMGVVGGVLYLTFVWPMGLRLIHGRWKTFLLDTIVRGIVPLLAALCASLAVRSVSSIQSWATLVVASIVVCGVYMWILTFFCLDPYDRSLAGQFTQRFKRWSTAVGTTNAEGVAGD